MSFGLGSLLGGGLGFLLGGPVGAAIGSGLGTAAGGGSTQESLLAAGAGYLGGEFLPGLMEGGAAAAGAGAGAGAAMGPLTAGELGAGFEGYMGGLGFAPVAGAAMGPMTAGELGAGFEGAMGAGGYSPLPAAGVEGPGMMDTLRRRMAQFGFGGGGAGGAAGGMPSGLRTALGGLQLVGGMQQLGFAQQQQAALQQRQAQQQQYAQQIAQLQANPSMVEGLPGYQAGLRATQRAARAEGFGGSGSMAAALAGYGGQQYQRQLANLAALQGPAAGYNVPMVSPMGAMTNLGAGAYGLFG